MCCDDVGRGVEGHGPVGLQVLAKYVFGFGEDFFDQVVVEEEHP